MTDTMMHVRIPPYNPSKGHVAVDRKVVAPSWSHYFRNGRWYKVNKAVCDAVLSKMYQRDNNPSSGPLFEIVTLQQAKAITVAEQKAALGHTEDTRRMTLPKAIPDIVTEDTDLNDPAPVHQLQVEAEAQLMMERQRAAEEAADARESDAVVEDSDLNDDTDDLLDGIPGVPKSTPKKKASKKKTAAKRKYTPRKTTKRGE